MKANFLIISLLLNANLLFGQTQNAVEGRYRCMVSILEIKHVARELLEVKDLMAGISHLAVKNENGNYTRATGEDSAQIVYKWNGKKLTVLDKRDTSDLKYKFESSVETPYNLLEEPYGSSFAKDQTFKGLWNYYNAQNEEIQGHLLDAATSYSRAITQLEVALNTGYPNPYVSAIVGKCYRLGKGTKQHFAKAMIFYARSLRYAESQWACAQMYDIGDVTLSQDWEKAVMCYKLCAKQNQNLQLRKMAYLQLGEFYLFGVGGIEKNEDDARACFDSARTLVDIYQKKAGANSMAMQMLANGVLNQAKSYENGGLDVKLGYDLLKPKSLEMGKNALLYRVTYAIPDGAEAVRVLPVFYAENDPEKDFITGFEYNPSPLYTANGTHNLTIYMKEKQARFVGQLYIGLYVYEKANDEQAAYVLPVKVPVQAAWIQKVDSE
ncbi:MAG: sel1 repeat family protein [Bacteroidetes bacterium]|nr:sel1 repeat family protein [Bacteroidota bacterium]